MCLNGLQIDDKSLRYYITCMHLHFCEQSHFMNLSCEILYQRRSHVNGFYICGAKYVIPVAEYILYLWLNGAVNN